MSAYGQLLGINFNELKVLMGKSGKFDLSILYGRLKYQVNRTKLTPKGKREIARTREMVAAYNGKGLTATDEDLAALVGMGAIDCRAGMWMGNKRMYIACNWDCDLGFNAEKFALMDKYTGSTKQSVMLSYFAYCTEKRPLHYTKGRFMGSPSVMVSKKSVANLLGVTVRTANAYMASLAQKGILQYQGRRLWGEGQYHVQINIDFYNKIVAEWAEIENALKETKRAKSGVSIKVNNDSRVENINNNTFEDENGNIILSMREQSYLAEAVKRTLARTSGVTWTFGALLAQVRYAMSSKEQRKGTQGFVHAINRAMFLVREGLWKMPFGYEKYTAEGKAEHEALREREKAHYEQKDPRALSRLAVAGHIPDELEIDVPLVKEPENWGSRPQDDEDTERARKMADLERRWQESRYGK